MAETGLPRPLHGCGAGVLGVVLLLLTHYLLALAGVWEKSVTYDETAHVTAGYAYWRFNDYRLNPENGNLPQRLAALPLVLSDAFTFPDRNQPAWRTSDIWAVGDQFLHKVGNDPVSLLRRSRSGMALLGTALCGVVFLWARSLYGPTGGFVALVLCAFSPTILANGPLATSDICATLFFTLSAWSLWLMLQRISLLRTLVCAAALSGLALSKTSAVLVIPMIALLIPAALLRSQELPLSLPGGKRLTLVPAPRRLLAMAAALLLCLLVAWGAVWMAFGCRYAPIPPEEQSRFQQYFFAGAPISTLPGVTSPAGTPGNIIGFLGRHRLLPEAFLYGTAFVFAAAHHYGFLNGQLSTDGWRTFFPYCFLVKSTLPLLLLLATALVASAAAWPGPARKTFRIPASAPLWVLLAVYWPALIFSTISIGARHMLPVYPATFILLGGWAGRRPRSWLRLWVVFLLCWHVGEGLRGFPHYLAYFNQVTGRRHAYRHLVDSSLDWGQDLPGLKAWLDRRLSRAPLTRVYLSYFGTGSPAAYGIAAEPIEFEERDQLGLPPAGAGVYCVSATNLQGVYYAFRGRWNARYEDAYQELRAGGRTASLDSDKLRWLRDRAGSADTELLLAELSTARLMAFLRGREPDDPVGYSILCYDLSRQEVGQALTGPPPEQATLPEN